MNKKIGGFDIGIKHLAFCIITKNNENKLVDINEWTNINLMEDDVHNCDGIMKNKTKCNAKSKFYFTDNNVSSYYCATHKTQHLEPKCPEIIKHTTKESCTHTNKPDVKCIKKGSCMINDNIYCKQHSDKFVKQFVKNNSLRPINKTNCMTTDPQILCTNIFNALNKYESFKLLNEVRIENQPGLTNPTMKAVASTVFAYFVFLNVTFNLNIIIKYVSPATKIKYSDDFILFMNNKINEHSNTKKESCKCKLCKLNIEFKKNNEQFTINYTKYKFSYDVFKLLSILYTEKILIDNNLSQKLELLTNIDKKDDPCDAFLHANKDLK
jgi:hypothetical protein